MKDVLNEMEEERKYRKGQLPRAVVENLDSLLESGLVIRTGKRGGTKYHKRAHQRTPAWVEAAEAAVAPEDDADIDAVTEEVSTGQLPATALTSFSLVLGNRAALIVQMCDGLTEGTIGLSAINDIKGQALLMLRDLNLLEV